MRSPTFNLSDHLYLQAFQGFIGGHRSLIVS